MIQVNKRGAPNVLTDDGAKFQNNAILFATGQGYDEDTYKKAFEKHGDFKNGQFTGFNSALFTDYSYYKHPTVKQQLITEQYGKCVFCEMFIMHGDAGDVEHFRPKSQVTVADHSVPSERSLVDNHPGYFWLSQTWSNLFLSCRQCNGAYKGTLFDVQDSEQRDYPGQQPTEQAMLLSPCEALNPRAVLRFNPANAQAFAQAGGDGNTFTNMSRAYRTIQIAGLNRPRLVEARAAHLVKLRALFVIAANGGGAQPNDEAPDILTFTYDGACAGSDAVAALNYAVLPAAEFSALAMDAIEKWNTELTLEMCDIEVAMGETNTVRMNTSFLRLIDQHNLETSQKQQNLNATALEAEPETPQIDNDYNTLLGLYKTRVKLVFDDKDAITQAQQDLVLLEQKLQPLHQQAAPLEEERGNLLESWSAYKKHVEYDNFMAEPDAAHRNALWSTYTLDMRRSLQRISTLTNEQRVEERDAIADWGNDPSLKQRYDALTLKLGEIDAERTPLLAEQDTIEDAMTAHESDLAEMQIEINEVLGRYQRAGVSATRRKARCHALGDAIGQLRTWLEDVNTVFQPIAYTSVPAFTINDHFQKNKWPARIST